MGGRTPWVSPPCTGRHGGVSGQDGGGHPADLGAWRVGPTRADATAAGAQPSAPPGPSNEDQVERADHGTLPPWGWGSDLSGPLSAWRSAQDRPPGGLRWRARDLSPSHSVGGNRRPPADTLARGGLSPAVAAACAAAPDAGRAVVWAVPSQPRGGPGWLSCGAWP